MSGVMASSPVSTLQAALLLLVTILSAGTDLWKGRIYNAVTYPAIVAGFAVQLYLHGSSGLSAATTGFAVGFFPALLLFAAGGLGGGDVKLMGAIGTIVGAIPATETLVIACLFGCVAALGKLAWRGTLFRTMFSSLWSLVRFRMPTPPKGMERLELRFGAVICIAALATLWDLEAGALARLL